MLSSLRRYGFWFILALASASAAAAEPVIAPWDAQSYPPPEQIRQIDAYQQQQTEQISAKPTAVENDSHSPAYPANPAPAGFSQSPAVTATIEKPAPFSTIEAIYASRVVQDTRQFGYDLFGVPTGDMRAPLDTAGQAAPSMPSGAVQDNFILSAGDELEIFFTGQRTDRGTYKVGSDGALLITDFPPIPAAGRTIGQVRISVEAAAKNLYNTTPYISLSSVRQIGVLVVGHAKRPGLQSLTVFHTVLDALMQAGGIEKTGSLRQIKLVRQGHSQTIDLYKLLLRGQSNIDLQLHDGDRIVVPPIGPTVAVTGEVKRPGIFEILPEGPAPLYSAKARKISLNEMLELSGGILAPGKNRFLRLEITPLGQEQTTEIADPYTPAFGDGSILMVAKGSEKREGTVELAGHARRPGLYAIAQASTLSALLSSDKVPGPDIYPLIGVIERTDPDQLTRRLFDFPPRLVIKGDYDRKLEDGDIVRLFSSREIESLIRPAGQAQSANIHPAALSPAASEENPDAAQDPVLAAFLQEHIVNVRGAVRKPGAYPVSEGIALDSLLAVSGDVSLEADTSNIEITSPSGGKGIKRKGIDLSAISAREVIVAPGDSLRVNQKFSRPADRSILIVGEVRSPGRYDLAPGDKISDLLARAGGLTEQAYPPGAVFSRETERKAEVARFHAQASAMEQAIAAALQAGDDDANAGKVAEARSLAAELRNAEGVGRITVEADPEVLSLKPELDMLLEPGDRLYIPKRTLSVRVSGEVLSPAALQFRENKAPDDYINEAGGYTYNADKSRTFVLHPDGRAEPLKTSRWSARSAMIPPGSTIVVPRDPKPFDFIQSAKDISQILSNLAVTAIFTDDLRDDN